MIVAPKQRKGYFVSAWVAGVALTMLVVGGHGATRPLLPKIETPDVKFDPGEEVLLEQFNPPAAVAEEKAQEPETVEPPDIEIPPLPVITPPLTPPEMVELTPLEELPPAAPAPKPLPQKP